MSLVTLYVPWKYLWIPLLYIFAVTAVSRGEVYGGPKKWRIAAALLFAVVIFGMAGLIISETGRWQWPLVFLLLLAVMVYRPLARAIRDGRPESIRAAVRGGVMGIVALDASWAAGYGPWWLPLLVMLLLPLAVILARRFSVT
jgi:4-hydroxybenzoate polyprenyltransferase